MHFSPVQGKQSTKPDTQGGAPERPKAVSAGLPSESKAKADKIRLIGGKYELYAVHQAPLRRQR